VQCQRLKLITPSQYVGLNVNYSKAGYTRGEPFPIPVEKPSRISEAVRHHLHDLRYSVDEIAEMLMLSGDEFSSTYTKQPRLRVIK
jgi:hypothetical protein